MDITRPPHAIRVSRTTSFLFATALLLGIAACTGDSAPTPRVDHHQHLLSPALAKAWEQPDALAAERLIELLDDAGIRSAVVMSLAYAWGSPGLSSKPADEYTAVRAENDWTAEQAAKYPDRLTAVCSVAPNQPVNPFGPVTRAQVVNALNARPFDFVPGTKWSYSNAAYMLLGYTIESITGRSYADFIHTELALPLGLIDTGVCGTASLPLREGYGLVNGSWVRRSSLHTSVILSEGSLCSTASDLVRWSHLLATGHAMLPASYTAMTTPATLENNTVVPLGYALGVRTQKVIGHPAVSHGGAVYGFLSFLLYLSDQDIAVAVITNAFPAPAAGHPEPMAVAIAKAALDAL